MEDEGIIISIVKESNLRISSKESPYHNYFLANIWGFTEYFVINL